MVWNVTWKSKIHFDKQPEKERGMFSKELSRKPQNVMKVCSVKSFLSIQAPVKLMKCGLSCFFQVFELRQNLCIDSLQTEAHSERSVCHFHVLSSWVYSRNMSGMLLDRLVNEKLEWASLMYDSVVCECVCVSVQTVHFCPGMCWLTSKYCCLTSPRHNKHQIKRKERKSAHVLSRFILLFLVCVTSWSSGVIR